jgi:hypothetical protein
MLLFLRIGLEGSDMELPAPSAEQQELMDLGLLAPADADMSRGFSARTHRLTPKGRTICNAALDAACKHIVEALEG